jgi:excisionase family DNA binding protein
MNVHKPCRGVVLCSYSPGASSWWSWDRNEKEEDLESNAEYVTYTQACALLGITRPLLDRRIKDGTLTVYQTGRNIKWRLLAKRELEDMVRIVPMKRGKETSDAGRVA